MKNMKACKSEFLRDALDSRQFEDFLKINNS